MTSFVFQQQKKLYNLNAFEHFKTFSKMCSLFSSAFEMRKFIYCKDSGGKLMQKLYNVTIYSEKFNPGILLYVENSKESFVLHSKR